MRTVLHNDGYQTLPTLNKIMISHSAACFQPLIQNIFAIVCGETFNSATELEHPLSWVPSVIVYSEKFLHVQFLHFVLETGFQHFLTWRRERRDT